MGLDFILQNEFAIKLAGVNIQVNTISPRTCILCRHYLTEEKTDITITVTEEEVEHEYRMNNNPERKAIFLETIVAYRKIVESLLPYHVFLMHGAVIARNNEAYMFTAPSGTGKTTHIRQWLKKAEGTFVVNGDKPLIKVENGIVYACGSPWSGNEHMNTNTMVPLKAIVFLERNEDNHIREVSFAEAYTDLLRQTHLPKNPEKAKETLNLLAQLSGKVKLYRFQCNNFKEDSFETTYNTLVNN